MVTKDKTRHPWKLYGLEYSEYSSFRMYSEKEYSFASLSIRFSPRKTRCTSPMAIWHHGSMAKHIIAKLEKARSICAVMKSGFHRCFQLRVSCKSTHQTTSFRPHNKFLDCPSLDDCSVIAPSLMLSTFLQLWDQILF